MRTMCGAVTVGFKLGREGRAYKLNRVVVCVLQQVMPDMIGGGRAEVRVTGIQVHHQEHWSAFMEEPEIVWVREKRSSVWEIGRGPPGDRQKCPSQPRESWTESHPRPCSTDGT